MDRTPELLFDYLRDLIYAPQKAALNVSELAPEYAQLGQGLLTLGRLMGEQRALASALARGELNVAPPGRDNELAAPLKSLQASLKHLTWQSQQVAKGDYKQRIDFMGEFSEAFNSMIVQLEARQRALEAEIEAGRQKAFALEQSNKLLTSVTMGISQALFVLGGDGQMLYQNTAAEGMLADPGILPTALTELARSRKNSDRQEVEFSVGAGERARYFMMNHYPIQWESREATACLLDDISQKRARMRALEVQVHHDSMTGLYNRYFGMKTLSKWVEQNRAFSLCFIDLDNLKYINDTYGHGEGDLYICAAANLLEKAGEGVLACRIGGDEFMLLCPQMTLHQAEDMLEEIRLRFQKSIREREKPYYSNLSYGAAEAGPNMEVSNLLSLADGRMYAHKQSQRKLWLAKGI